MPSMVQLFTPNDAAWDSWVTSVPHDIYFTAAYHQFAMSQNEGDAKLAVYTDGSKTLLWPYLIRPINKQYNDAHAVYGYAGPIGNALDDADFIKAAWQALTDHWQQHGLVTLFFRFHPLLNNARLAQWCNGAALPEGGEVLNLGHSVSIDLRLDSAERQRKYKKNVRQEVRAAYKKGLRVEVDETWEHLDTLVTLYQQTMAKNSAEQRYWFDTAYFRELKAALKDKAILTIATDGSDIAAALMTTVSDRFAQAHLTGVNAAFASLSPLKCLIDGTADYLKQTGAEFLHLGAGRGGKEDDLYRFKSRFSDIRHDFCVGRYILDKHTYEQLSQSAPLDPYFFPGYRHPDCQHHVS